MKLTYRGTNYECDIPAVDMIESEVGGKYRGQDWSYRYPRHIPVPQQAQDLKYRGVEYNSTITPKIETSIAKQTVESRNAIALTITKPCVAVTNIAKIHSDNLCNILDRRLQVARAKGDERLLHLLEREAQQMAC